jgi:hypothetical protein
MMSENEFFELVECQWESTVASPFLRFDGNRGTRYMLPLRRGGFDDALKMMGKSTPETLTWAFCPWCGEKLEKS